jgi:hypothetical protein
MHKYLIIALVLLAASPAYAATIDFGDDAFAAAEGSGSYSTSVDGVGVTITAAPIDTATIEHSSDGIGVDYYDLGSAEQQIEGSEVLTVEFDELVEVTELSVTNLYDWGIIQVEVGSYTIDGDTTEFTGTSSDGTLTVPVDGVQTTSISFRASGDWFSLTDNGFTLESITFSSLSNEVGEVPELDPNAAPAAVALVVGSTMVLRERRRSQA